MKLIKIEKMSIRPCEKKIVAKRIDFNKIGFARKDCGSRSAIEGAITGFLEKTATFTRTAAINWYDLTLVKFRAMASH